CGSCARTSRERRRARSSSFLFQAEDGIRDRNVTGVQTCALPICGLAGAVPALEGDEHAPPGRVRGRHVQAAHGVQDAHAISSPGQTTPSAARIASIVPITSRVSFQLIRGDSSSPPVIRRAASAISYAVFCLENKNTRPSRKGGIQI